METQDRETAKKRTEGKRVQRGGFTLFRFLLDALLNLEPLTVNVNFKRLLAPPGPTACFLYRNGAKAFKVRVHSLSVIKSGYEPDCCIIRQLLYSIIAVKGLEVPLQGFSKVLAR